VSGLRVVEPSVGVPEGPAASTGRDGLVVVSEPLGGGALARAALAGQTPQGWFERIPTAPAAWRARAESVRAQFAAGAWLHLLEPALAASGAAGERLARVAAGAGVVVTTGQQPGLFGGPVYTFSKALGALALADELERATGIPVAPVFWAATDDADFAEASYTVIAVPGGAEELRAEPTAAEGTPMSLVPLGDDVPELLRRLEQTAGSAAFAPALDALRGAYRPGATVGDAYVVLLRALLEPLGIAVLDASHPAVREAGFHSLRRALLGAAEVERVVAARSAEITAAGFTPQVPDVAGRSLVFRSDGDGRKERVAVADARGLVTKVRHGELGPNVLLRPVVERAILPTLAYAAEPGELSYFAQVSAVAAALGAAAPLAVPRWSGTILEPHVLRILDRYGLTPGDLADPHAVETRLAAAAVPAGVSEALGALRDSVHASLDRARAAGSADFVDDAVLAGTERAIAHRVERLERRLRAAAKRRETSTMRDIGTARGALYPLGTRQERALNLLPTLARHGGALWEAMLAQARRHAESLVNGGRPWAP
jgi:bacillithiol biosynthesis cysteine-adding enzyme BshC